MPTLPPPPTRSDVEHFLADMFGADAGVVTVAIGGPPQWTANGYETKAGWQEYQHNWPAERDAVVARILDNAAARDVYICTGHGYLNRSLGSLKAIRWLHADWDGDPADTDECVAQVEGLIGFTIATGTPGHLQCFVPLAEPVTTAAEYARLCKAFQARLPPGTDAKRQWNDVCRIPGTFNHKSTVRPGDTGQPTPVEHWGFSQDLAGFDGWPLADLAAMLGLDTTGPESSHVGPGITNVPTAREIHHIEPPDAVRASVALSTGDRSADTARIVGVCHDAGLTLPETRGVIASRADLAERVEEFFARNPSVDDVLKTWLLVADSRQARRREQVEAEAFIARHQKPTATSASAAFFGLADDAEVGPWGTVTGDRFILDRPKNIPAIWGTGNRVLWAEGEGFMLAGTQGLGKTSIAGQLVRELLGLGTGVLFGLPVTGSGEVILYLAMDRPRQIARSMARQFEEHERDALRAGLIIRPGPPPADIAKQPDLLLRMADGVGARIVVVDSVKDAALGLSEDEVGASYNRARQLLLADGRQHCDLHHTVKRNVAGGAPSSIADIYGSTWLTSGCGSVVLLTGDPGDPIVKWRHVKQPAEEVGPWTLIADPRTGMFTVSAEVDLVALADRGEGDEAEGVTARAAAVALFETDKPTKPQVEKARRRLDELADAGRLFRRDGLAVRGAGARWFPTGRGAE